MEKFTSCKLAISECLKSKYYSIAHLHNEEKTMDMHIHDCYEIYYSISGGKQFLIDNRFYDINPGNLFVINQFESHYLTPNTDMVHERIVISIHPDFAKKISTEKTNLDYCFTERSQVFNHRISLTKEQQQRFLYFVGKITTTNEFGSDIIERVAFMELMLMINSLFINNNFSEIDDSNFQYHQQVSKILSYIDQHITDPLTVEHLAEQFYISTSYICRIFKATTGTTINKYINARRITIAKSLLMTDLSISEVCEKCGFNDYSNFLKAFNKAVGISPKKYASCSTS
ncbi:AraC-like DNA-binding protein/mannose-6-phosphate isomerase-like protein (cupin superfamily) [Sporomusaceae bacterium BoRhaA]|uniref:AraC family transcriptional regulator n=1 Tax=Pelorhabdus rhamnosifermentans TaxID=2772457 RepID=UPI001C05FF91|nr:AraC family transcriptional regulator [Pelorhabdus rhamnosifermentans]MBU2699318.1 AraC-like DNA-binding protein/mannose-6-phosphate isomerase-like protein (cupin superfamily) [Pelorhabdus rhamnosifermentans]